MLDLMFVTVRDIAVHEAFADELMRIAGVLEESDRPNDAANVRGSARHHRVKALGLRGQLAALSDRYDKLFDGEPETNS
ncbi:hypothetical protein [Methylobacterium soli]|uniref:Uncharacterized protein n=1 Tax=Methylobacterium soli TaxID=553447 RepID=A0A6L3SY56_9HYPH|nr:hypothetical protein [Methylobacterium soli]KAB1077146.1 hypothetical protein F6X53_19870 [Methylobacterium soli]GJE43912.1 hypothetical protein AEGHOMDF_3092 [Methylobacterium soli]